MKQVQLYPDYIEAYLQGRLPAEQAQLVEQELERKGELYEQMREALLIKALLWSYGREMEKAELKRLAPRSLRPFVLRMVSMAAAIVLLTALVHTFSQPPSPLEDTFRQYYTLPLDPEILTPIAKEDSLLYAGHYQFNTGDYAQASQTYQRWLRDPDHQKRSEAHYYLGLSRMELGVYEKAIRAFRLAKDYEEQARWYTALAYLKLGRLDRARPLIEHIRHAPRHYYQQRAE